MELVEDQLPWVPRVPPDRSAQERVLVRIKYDEVELRLAAKNAGARWHQERKLWELPLGAVYALGLDQRIVSALIYLVPWFLQYWETVAAASAALGRRR